MDFSSLGPHFGFLHDFDFFFFFYVKMINSDYVIPSCSASLTLHICPAEFY